MVPVEMLRRYPYFAGASPATLRDIAEITEERSFHSGQTLFCDGGRAEALMILVEGSVDLVFEFREAAREQTVDSVVAGDMFCWSAVLDPYQLHATARARSDGRLLAIDAPRIRELCERDSVLGHRLMAQIASVVAGRLDGARVQLAAQI